jgi:uncharacterized protein YjbJ (UPF0337 family)
MAKEDKAANKAKEIRGGVKEVVGEVTDDDDLKAEGLADQVQINLQHLATNPLRNRPISARARSTRPMLNGQRSFDHEPLLIEEKG